MKTYLWAVGAVFLLVLIFGWNPLAEEMEVHSTIEPGYTDFETGTRRLPNGTYQVSALTTMPDVSSQMARWWFSDFLQTTEQYKWWHPQDHVWMDWENKRDGEVIGASHLVHEFIGGELNKLRIQFVDPAEFFEEDPNSDEIFAICARVGSLEDSLYIAKMCHVVRNTPWGAEMRSRFWMGHVATRNGNEVEPSLAGLIGNTAIVRFFAVDETMAAGLLKHATEEMSYLAQLLPALYARETAN